MTTHFKPTVLWAEDEAFHTSLVRQVIKEQHDCFYLAEATSGTEVLRILEDAIAMQILPQLIVLDINMPGMDGRKTLVNIITKQELKDIPKVLFSASNSMLDNLFCMRYNVPLVFKSSNPQDCKQAIKNILQNHLNVAHTNAYQ